jgi:hypothetical protein
MKKNLLVLISVFMFTGVTFGQLSGTYYIPIGGGTPSYATIQAAVNDLNTLGISGSVIFNVATGYTESVTSPILLTAAGTSANTIIFQKDGSGANPAVIRTDAGTVTTTTVDAQGDGIIIIEGSDFVTFDGIDVTSQNEGIEYGYYLRKTSATDACKNVTIKNSVVTMTKGTSPYVCGIYSSNNDAASLPSNGNGITVASTDGRTENLLIIGNTVQNTHCGIRLRGFNHTAAPYQFLDQNNIVGQSGAGNIVQNFGGGSSAQFVHGIYVIYQTNAQMNYNTVDNAAGGGTASISNLHGIYLNGTVGGGDVQINNNTIKLAQEATNYVYCIINNAVTCSSIEINNNQFSFGFYRSTSPSYLIYNSSATNNVTVTGNSNLPFTKTAVGNLYGYYCNTTPNPTGGTANISNNNFSNITMAGGSFWGIQHSANNQVITIANNNISNLINYGNSIGILQGRGNAGSTVSNNIIENWSGGGNFTGISAGNPASLGVSVYNNRVRNITTTNTGASLYVYGILTSFGNPCSIYNNEVYNLEANNSNATVYGINVGSSFGTSVHNIYNNFVSDLRTPITNAAINLAGISVLYGTTVNVFNNTVYLNATSTGALFGSAAIYAAGSSANPVLDLRNNVLVNVSVPNGTGITAAYRRSNSTLTNYSNNSNANCFYAGTPGPNNLIFFDGTTPYQTLSDYKTLVAPRDAASFTELPPFINVAATPYDLHIQTGVNTLCESGGLVVSSPFAVTDDFDSQPRYPNTGYPENPSQPATAPDAGADEFSGGGPSSKTLNLTSVFLQGLYNGAGTMRQVYDEFGPHFPSPIADHITVELHDAVNYTNIIYTASSVNLSTTGTASISVPSTVTGTYYITIKHRNSLQTVSATAKSFAGSSITQSFGTPADVFGGNLVQMADLGYAIYGGDVNQDGIVDGSDFAMVDNLAAQASSGYLPEDVNGDGLIDGSDFAIIDNIASQAIGAVTP